MASDETWKLTANGPIRANNEYDGEEYDARDGTGRLEPRRASTIRSGKPAQAVAAPAGVLAAQMAEPLRVTETLKPVSVKKLKPGVFIFDMGQNMVGWCRLRVSGAEGHAGRRCATRRRCEPDGTLYVANLRGAKATDVYTLKGGGAGDLGAAFHLSRFPLRGSHRLPRHAGGDGASKAGWCTTTWTRRRLPSSNELLNKIHRNMFWGIRGNYRSIPTDCPQRDERQGWLGDRGAGEPQRESTCSTSRRSTPNG